MAGRITHTPQPANCGNCGSLLDAALDHNGRPGGPPRKFCSVDCRDDARNSRRRARRPVVGAHCKQHAGLIALHAEEDRGQLPLPVCEPLPPIPPLEVSA